MSRCLGDLNDVDAGIISTPEVHFFELGQNEEEWEERFVVLASDGVWEHLSDEDVIEQARPSIHLGPIHLASKPRPLPNPLA